MKPLAEVFTDLQVMASKLVSSLVVPKEREWGLNVLSQDRDRCGESQRTSRMFDFLFIFLF